MEALYVIGAAIIATVLSLVRANGKHAGKKEEKKKSAVIIEKMEVEVADAIMEEELSKPVGAKLAAMRKLLAERRSARRLPGDS